nr:hypothetical protein HK105_007629 [Polyrhizophydium stewartii]
MLRLPKLTGNAAVGNAQKALDKALKQDRPNNVKLALQALLSGGLSSPNDSIQCLAVELSFSAFASLSEPHQDDVINSVMRIASSASLPLRRRLLLDGSVKQAVFELLLGKLQDKDQEVEIPPQHLKFLHMRAAQIQQYLAALASGSPMTQQLSEQARSQIFGTNSSSVSAESLSSTPEVALVMI